ncbi:CYFA0S11e00826g1_1 [Cyberlindnera fabianii]|uniref:CYFA0S11e00826g1_1 n=1 Tax=Cyberlindnera fabianii TaxID=36022 RepID=A0A061B029_CYBFA|nr:CYFA0S11e00826g1_1 [Cyberlindnera fabianii]
MSALHFDKFLLFGDSITEFAYEQHPPTSTTTQFVFGSAISNAYVRRLDVVQRGFAGYNTNWALKMLPKILEQVHTPDSQVKIATVFFGTNDAALGGIQKVELEEYKANTSKFLDLFAEIGTKVVLIGPAKHYQEPWHALKPEDVAKGIIRTNENNKIYSEAAKALAKDRGVAFVDLYTAFDTYDGDWTELLIDGVHFTGKGYEIMYNEVMKAIRDNYPEFAPENLEYKLPYWRDFNKAESFEQTLDEVI